MDSGTTCSHFEERSISNFNVTELEERLNRTVQATANTSVEGFLKKLGIAPAPRLLAEWTEYIALVFLVFKIIKGVKQGIEFLVKFITDLKAKKKSENEEVSLREGSVKLSVKTKKLVGVGICPAADFILISRDGDFRKVTKNKVEEVEQTYRGIVIAIGAGVFMPNTNQYQQYEFAVQDQVMLKNQGLKVYDEVSKSWYYLYHIRDVVAAYKET